ncbi:MAG: RNA-binding protein [Alphaproteobacteria bacterium]|nr:RNA-binding protein [Alphaproteobacteria bacterium]
MRRCLASGQIRPKVEMIRFAVSPDGVLVPDLAARLPGRGLWLSPERDMVNTALTKGLFAKAARQKVAVPPDLAERLLDLAKKRCLEILGLARGAGQVVAGFDQVRDALVKQSVALHLEASDGAPDGRRKLAGKMPELAPVMLFSGTELGQALGREHVVHVAVLPGGLARRLKIELARLGALQGNQTQAIK